MPTEAAPGRPDGPPPDRFDRPTTGGRLAVGAVLALGVYLGLRKVVSAAALAAGPGGPWWLSLDGLVAVYALQAAAVAFGGLVAAAGRPHGFPVGLTVGGACGGLFLAAEAVSGVPVLRLVFLLPPPLLAAVGGAAGAAGARVWAAVPDLDIRPPEASNLTSSIKLGMEPRADPDRPTRWVRVAFAAVLMAVGFASADDARFAVQRHSLGLLHTESIGQGKFLSWQLATVLVLVAGAGAGAGTGAGLRHGLFAGFLGGLGAVGLIALRGGRLAPQAEYQFAQLSLVGVGALDPAGIAATAGGVVLFGAIGGWLGGQLYLPLAAPHARSRRFKATD